ncbi:hypothetical protein WGM54_18505 [Paenibacillus polymyxa]|uniref:hypothetical protein n=1 Tax=Paenibacillus polymyxa TaxID=1406 RepID=UPI00307E1FA8
MLPLIKEFHLNQKLTSYLKLILVVIILAAAIVPVAPSRAHAFSGTGNGAEQDPYIITTAAILDDFRTNPSAYYNWMLISN